jgi:DNA topoisomerase-1
MVAERKSRKGRTFYGCANYPACDFVSWDRVVPDPCPECGGYVTAKTKRGGVVTFVCHTDKTHDTSTMGGAAATSDEEERPSASSG